MSKRRDREREASQNERLISYALPGRVLHQDDWYRDGADGKGPVKALRSRISQLEREHGYGFHHHRRPDGTVEYRLAYVPDAAPPRPRSPAPATQPCEEPPAPLFELPPEPAVQPSYRDWDAA